jgi:hypothetical protein
MMKTRKYLSLLAVIILLILSSPNNSFSQCAMCKKTVESNMENGSSQVGKGLNKGILYMMSIPYLLGAAGGIIWYRNRKKIEKGKVQ